ncbi:MAG: glycoside hydrolase family 15 protein [Nanoarchaeota archaeon]|jgi:oligosaccharide amylase|nr:glycoside hydrolase family 15 protein [Nanoarchaeota archaeon]
MTRKVILGNGNMLICFDKNARIRDFYYPYVGQENHVSGNIHRTGIWVDGQFEWVNENDWELLMKYQKDSLVSEIFAYNPRLEVELIINEAVHPTENVFVRHVKVINKSSKKREIRLFFSQRFDIAESNIGDTVYFDPKLESLIDYKGKRYFLIGGESQGKPFVDYATGGAGGVGNKLGTYVDCEDGVLSKNPIEHGAVDSAIGFHLDLEAGAEGEANYWIAVGKKYSEISKLKSFILNHGAHNIIKHTENYWNSWIDNKKIDFYELGEPIQDLFRRSLLIVRAQTDNHGAIIAANDTHTFHFKKDTYSYMWPRDGALVARSLDKVGHKDITTKFFKFCSGLISQDGYLLHKYRPDGSFGSSWHSWFKGNKIQLPIQEDETALMMDALWKHFIKHEDQEMIREMYEPFIKKAADFMVSFRDPETKLPRESYDLWEEKLGVHTFTCATVYAGLEAAKNFAKVFGTTEDFNRYDQAAKEVKEATIKYMFDSEMGVFIKGIYYDDKENMKFDKTIDISTFYSLFEYEILAIDDARLVETAKKTVEKLWCMCQCGGLARYENDMYYRKWDAPMNPWIISTMWLCEYYIAKAKKLEDLKPAEDLLKWTTEKALDSGVLSEQLEPHSSKPLSVAPLTWSHAGFIIAVVKYLERYAELNKK